MYEQLRNTLGNKIPIPEMGQDLAEYAMLIGLIAILVVVTVTLLGTQIGETFRNIAMGFGAVRIGG